MTLIDPKSCPFCGNDDLVYGRDVIFTRKVYLWCAECGTRGPWATINSTEPDEIARQAAIKAWNERKA